MEAVPTTWRTVERRTRKCGERARGQVRRGLVFDLADRARRAGRARTRGPKLSGPEFFDVVGLDHEEEQHAPEQKPEEQTPAVVPAEPAHAVEQEVVKAEQAGTKNKKYKKALEKMSDDQVLEQAAAQVEVEKRNINMCIASILSKGETCPYGHAIRVAQASLRGCTFGCRGCGGEVSFVCTGGVQCGFLACKACTIRAHGRGLAGKEVWSCARVVDAGGHPQK